MSEKTTDLTVTGRIVDMGLEEFESELKRQKVNVGIVNNLILYLSNIYDGLRVSKDRVIAAVKQGKLKGDNPDVDKSLKGLYAEMQKIEDKVVFLRSYRDKLLKG